MVLTETLPYSKFIALLEFPMKLIPYLNSLTPPAQIAFALKCETTVGYLRKACAAGENLRPKLCVSIEKESNGEVTRAELRDDYLEIWPELAKKAA